jgi:adenosylhomocysteine nucleosidase
MGPQLADLFLEFTSRQIRRYYGFFDLTVAEHLDLLCRWINVAAWLCDDYCLVPIGFPLECFILRRALTRKAELLTGGVIELPLRGSFEAFVARRRETYSPYAEDFADLYDDDILKFVQRFSMAFKDRRNQSAESLVDRWSAGPDNSPLWIPISRLGLAATRRISKIPEIIHRSEAGIVWQGVLDRLAAADRAAEDPLQRILQSDFVESYCEEYGTDTLSGLPQRWRDLRREPATDGALNYRNFSTSVGLLGIGSLVERLSSETMLAIRQRAGYLNFIARYRAIAGDRSALKLAAAGYGDKHGERGRALSAAALARTPRSKDVVLTETEAAHLDQVLFAVAEDMQHDGTIVAVGLPKATSKDRPNETGSGKMSQAKPRIAIFVALDEERKVLEKSNLKLSKDLHPQHLVGEKDGVTIELFCAHGMGRVAAAVATMKYLNETTRRPDLLVVAGLAGGFPKAGMTEGAIIIPDQVFDLALRKIKGDETQFRPETYRTDPRLKNYIVSNAFDSAKWSAAAHSAADWPDHLRPNIRHDPLTSVDEVVSSIEHGDQLRKAFPKLAGVEMEAGGVFAAAREFNVDVSVIRAVSDNADPAKTDDAWRARAMKTIASLLCFVDLAVVLNPNNK